MFMFKILIAILVVELGILIWDKIRTRKGEDE